MLLYFGVWSPETLLGGAVVLAQALYSGPAPSWWMPDPLTQWLLTPAGGQCVLALPPPSAKLVVNPIPVRPLLPARRLQRLLFSLSAFFLFVFLHRVCSGVSCTFIFLS